MALFRLTGVTAVVLALAVHPAGAQNVCRTSNCAEGATAGVPNRPPGCLAPNGDTLASPRFITIDMVSSSLIFDPSNIRIEGAGPGGTPWSYQCVEWEMIPFFIVPDHSSTEVGAGGCAMQTGVGCGWVNQTPPEGGTCDWESGDITPGIQFASCHYRDVTPAMYPFHCRRHFASGMTGTMVVVAPLTLTVSKGTGSNIQLDWATGGSAGGPWELFRSADRRMPFGSTVDITPAGGTALRSFTDTGVAAGSNAFYMVRECNPFSGAGCKR